MKIAVCFSGIIRTGNRCVDNIRRFIGELWQHCDFFVHTWDYETVKPFARKSWNGIPFIARQPEILDLGKLEAFRNYYNPKLVQLDSYHKFIEEYPKTRGNIVWHTMSRCFELKKKYEDEHNFSYDAVIKIRPDVIFPPNRRLPDELKNTNLNSRNLYSDIYTDYRLDDVFWILNSNVANDMIGLPYYFENYEPHEILHQHNPIVLGYLQSKDITHARTPHGWPHYTIYRPEAYMLDPMTDFRYCQNVDRIHYSSAHTEEEFKRIFERERTISYD
jgi:hypothetical protein